MTFTTMEAIEAVRGILEGENGLADSLEALKESYADGAQRAGQAAVTLIRTPAELQEKAWTQKYPLVHVYCDRIESRPEERLRRFSGRIRVMAELRVSQDRLDGLTPNLYYYVDGVRDVLERSAGCLREGLYLSNEYEVQVEPVKKGGLNFLQTAKIACSVIVNRG